jgi:glutamate dehydrogenase
MMTILESRGLLDRGVEFLPGPQALAEREARGEKLTRAEIGVLLAYAKLTLFDEIVASSIPDEPHFETDLIDYFPPQMQKKYAGEIKGHRLRREIIATHLANDVIDRGGPAFVTRLQDFSGRPAHDIVAAFAIVRDGFDLPALFQEIDALDTRIDGMAQLDLYERVWHLIHGATAWLLKNGDGSASVSERIVALRAARKALEPALKTMLPAFTRDRVAEQANRLEDDGVSPPLAAHVASLGVAELIPDIALVASSSKAELKRAAQAFFAVTEAFRIDRIEEAARGISPSEYYEGLALSRANDMIGAARRGIAIAALQAHKKADDPVAAWSEAGGERIVRVRERLQSLTESGDLTVSRLTVAAGLMSDLMTL